MFNFKEWFKEKVNPHKHDWTLSYLVGDFHKYRCKDKTCDEKKYTLESRATWDFSDEDNYKLIDPTYKELTPEEAAPYIEKSESSLKATMWLLDNVEPTYSAGRDDGIDYPYKTEDGKIVPNIK